MKNLFFLSTLLILNLSTAFSQTDTIFKTNGKLLAVNIVELTETSIRYSYPNETMLNTIDKVTVSKIHFKSGRIEEFGSVYNTQNVTSCLDCQNVQLSKIESEVRGMRKLSNVGAKAKGLTAYSSTAKLQERAFNKSKMQAAMLGGNVIFILDQSIEEAISGGQYGGSKMPAANFSGIAYSSRQVYENEIEEGTYSLKNVQVLKTNEYELMNDPISKPESINIKKSDLVDKNSSYVLNATFSNLPKLLNTYTIIYADKKKIVLSGVLIGSQGKTTYYNLFLDRQN